MKKIALLFTILCAGALNGMESTKLLDSPLWKGLPEDMKRLIVMASINSGNDLDSAINNIKKASMLNKALNQMVNNAYGNPKGFAALLHMLAKKFNTSSYKVAEKFNTPAAEKYFELYRKIAINIYTAPDTEYVKQLIADGADITNNPILYLTIVAMRPLPLQKHLPIPAMIALLLEHEANPYVTGDEGETALERLNRLHQNSPAYKQIKSLLEEAMKKKQ